MKRWREPQLFRSNRPGTLLHYVKVYMAVASALMTTCGICLHTILKADTRDRSAALFLSTLRRVDQQIRRDHSDGAVVRESETRLSFVIDATNIQWNCDRGILTREERRGEEVRHSERYIFPAGSAITFLQRNDRLIVLSILEPDPSHVRPSLASGGSVVPSAAAGTVELKNRLPRKPVEIHLNGAQP
jgi:hypothetical protein